MARIASAAPPSDENPQPAFRGRPSGALSPEPITVAGNELTVFVETPALLDAMVRDIQKATRRVWLETYIFHFDSGAQRIAEVLIEKARQGLDVRVHYDAVGSVGTPASFFAPMIAAGVQVHAYHSLLEGFRRFQPLRIVYRRNHRKLLIVDDFAGYFGGMNIIDNTGLAPPDAGPMPLSAGWRDVHVRLSGPMQGNLAESFDRSWCRALGIHQPKKPRKLLKAQLRAAAGENGGGEAIHFFDSGGARNRLSRAARIYTRLIDRARRQITIAMAYFVPVGGPLRALLAARKRHVGVRVVVPGISDVPVVQRATTHLYDRLIRRGFRIFERRGRMLHSKMMVIDGLYSVVGSANLDPRSMRINLEFVAVIRSEAFARVLTRIARFEMAQSQRITLSRLRRISRLDRLLNRLAWLLRWWL